MEHTWNKDFRAFLYIVGLLWCFVGVSVLSDVFMAGIEAITNSTYKRKIPRLTDSGEPAKDANGNPEFDYEDTLIWNPAVANLTLMALGSSTPEILLSIIEITGQGFFSGDLGPGTVVGSAAFNLYVITAMCMMALPEGEGRKIDNLTTFFITSFHSLFAYLWMAISLLVISPDVVELWEALVTLGAMPWLTFWVWCADNNWFRKEQQVYPAEQELQPVHKNKDAGRTDGDDPRQPVQEEDATAERNSDTDVGMIKRTQSMREKNVNMIKHRHNALAQFIGGKSKSIPTHDEQQDERLRKAREDADAETELPVFQFEAENYAFLETVGQAMVKVTRGGKIDLSADVLFATADGSGVAGKAYEAKEEVLHFAAGQRDKTTAITVIHDKVWNDDKQFALQLSLPEGGVGKVGAIGKAVVTIIDMDGPGVFCWMEGAPHRFLSSDSKAHLVVERRRGCSGAVRVRVKTVEGTAREGVHFGKIDEEMEWDDGEAAKGLQVELKQFAQPESDEPLLFYVELAAVVNGKAEIGESRRAEVFVTWNAGSELDGLDVLEDATWAEQFRQALSVGGGEGVEDAGTTDLVMHYLSITWKLLAAFIPPPYMAGGWATFWVALCMIGVVTAIIGDLASIFGCLVGLQDSVTAITIVALGTSLPDTFASVLAIRADDNADNAIGNVTGSNSINVFLGLGLPWTMAAIYWGAKSEPTEKWHAKYRDHPALYAKYKDTGAFVVLGGSLGFNTLVFTILTLFAFFLFGLRRYTVGYEIGGPKNVARLSACVFFMLWIVYILLSSLQVYHPNSFIEI